jgi:hypothetical protein
MHATCLTHHLSLVMRNYLNFPYNKLWIEWLFKNSKHTTLNCSYVKPLRVRVGGGEGEEREGGREGDTINEPLFHFHGLGVCIFYDTNTKFEVEQSRDSSVGIALGYGLDDRSSRVRFPAENISLHHRVQNGSGAHPASYPMATRGSFLGREADHHLHLVPRSKNEWSYTPTLPICIHGVVLS